MENTSEVLLERAKAGAPGATEQLFLVYRPFIFQIARFAGIQNHADLEDLAQDTLLELFRKVPTFERRGTGSLRRWLRIVTVRTAARVREQIRALKTVDVQHLDDLDAASEETVSHIIQQLTSDQVIEALWSLAQQELSGEQVQVFEERVLRGRPAKDVAEQFGISSNTVYLTQSRVMKRIRELAKELYDTDPFEN